MKKLILMSLSMVILLVLSACGGDSGQEEDGVTRLSMWVHIAHDTLEGRAYGRRVDAFNEAYEGEYEVRIEYIPRGGGGTGYEDRINAALTTGSLPDVISLDGPNTAAYARSNILIDLSDYISEESQADFLPSALDQGMYDGGLYSLAIQESTTAVYYNKDMFVTAGLCDDVATCSMADIKDPRTGDVMNLSLENPWTYEQFKAVAEALRDQFDREAIQLPTGQDEMITYAVAPFVWNNGGDIVSADGLTASGILNSAENIEAFNFLQSLFTEGMATDVPTDNGFYIGHYPMMLDGIWGVPILELTYAEEIPHWGVMPIPVGKTGEVVASTGSWAFGVTSMSGNHEAAALLAEWMTNTESTNHITGATGLIPARHSALEVNDAFDSGVRETLRDLLVTGGKARPTSVAYPEITDAFQRVYIEIMVTRNAPEVEAVLNQHTEALQTRLNRHGN